MKKIIVNGNNGTGKSTLVKALKKKGYDAVDCKTPSEMTDNLNIKLKNDEIYIILDANIKTCQNRLLEAGKSLDKQFNNKKDLTNYRTKFLEVAEDLQNCIILNTNLSKDKILERAITFINLN